MAFPPVTKLYTVLLVAFSIVTFTLRYSAYLHLLTDTEGDDGHLIEEDQVPHPAQLYVPLISLVSGDWTRPWTFLTCGFIEDGITGFFSVLSLVVYAGSYIEKLWGSREFFRYLTTTLIVSNFLVFLWLGMTGSIGTPITGCASVVMALAVAIKQRIPNHFLLFLDGSLRLKVSQVPFIMMCTTSVLSLISDHYEIVNLQFWLGFAISWTLLRFCKDGGSGRQLTLLPINSGAQLLRGDRTSQFALDTFFPYPISLAVRFVSGLIFRLLCNFKLLSSKDFISESDDTDAQITQAELISQMNQSRLMTSSSLAGVSGEVSLLSFKSLRNLYSRPSSESTTSTRREMALKQLEERLAILDP
jgi:membrane associated rhomboid family serine protease